LWSRRRKAAPGQGWRRLSVALTGAAAKA